MVVGNTLYHRPQSLAIRGLPPAAARPDRSRCARHRCPASRRPVTGSGSAAGQRLRCWLKDGVSSTTSADRIAHITINLQLRSVEPGWNRIWSTTDSLPNWLQITYAGQPPGSRPGSAQRRSNLESKEGPWNRCSWT